LRITLTIKGFLSIREARIELANPTFVVGRNGSGKTNFTDAFALIAETTTSPLQAIFDRRGGIRSVATRRPRRSPFNQPGYETVRRKEQEPVGFAICFEEDGTSPDLGFSFAKFAFEVCPLSRFEFEVAREQCIVVKDGQKHFYDRTGTRVHSNLDWMTTADHWGTGSALLLPIVGNSYIFYRFYEVLKNMRVFSIQPNRLREPQIPETGSGLKADGSNAPSVLKELKKRDPDTLQRVEQILESVSPHISRIRTVQQGKQLSLKFTQEFDNGTAMEFDGFSMSDGTLRVLGLLLAVFQRPQPSVAVIEEPEATIHPGALGTIMDVFRTATRHMQLVITTHSPDLLDTKWIGPENLRIATWEDGVTRISDIGEMPCEALRAHLMGAGELLRSNALEPTELFGDSDQLQLALFEDELK
jgi:predicted ATPase